MIQRSKPLNTVGLSVEPPWLQDEPPPPAPEPEKVEEKAPEIPEPKGKGKEPLDRSNQATMMRIDSVHCRFAGYFPIDLLEII